MSIQLLTFGDVELGRSLHDWGNEFAYAMGAFFDFERDDFGRKATIALAIVCLPPAMAGMGNRTVLKRSASEFWSTFEADYEAFSSRSAANKISAIATALKGAIQQIPDSRMPAVVKEEFIKAISLAATKLLGEPARHPR